ncbi:putative leucine-rich repeat-containing protein DDB_G0290503 isoform X2 [Melanaphis sacchari]|nr:putative leucine-rich repeat-containing protein DDB_G0290503 isoform X2 [Melanaphis sacchari]
MTNYNNMRYPDLPQSTYLNNKNNQQYINYKQQPSMPQPYNAPQQYTPQEQNHLQPMSQAVHHNVQHMNTFQPPLTVNQNQQSHVPQSNNLYLPLHGSRQGVSHSYGTVGPPPKEYQQQLPMNLNPPIQEKLQDFGEDMNNARNQGTLSQTTSPIPLSSNQPKLSQIPSQPSLNPTTKVNSTPNKNNIEIKEKELLEWFKDMKDFNKNQETLSQTTSPIPLSSNQPKLSQIPSQPSLNPTTKVNSTPNKNNIEIKEVELPEWFKDMKDFNKNQETLSQSTSPIPLSSNQSKLSQIPLQPSLNPMVKGSSTSVENIVQNMNDSVFLDSVLGLPDDQLEPRFSDVEKNQDVLIDSSLTDIKQFLNSENIDILYPPNYVLENQDDSQLVLSDEYAINESHSNESKSFVNNDTENLQNALNDITFPTNFEDTKLNEESKLEKAISELSIFPLDKVNEENDVLYSLENLIPDKPPEFEELSKYDNSYIVNTENPKNAKEDNAKLTVFANPNDIHILQQSLTNDNSYINNNLLNTPSTDMPLLYGPSFPNSVDYVQPFNSNANNQLPNSLLSVNQKPVGYNQIPMYLANSNDYDQQVAPSAVDQNQMTSKIQSPGLSLDAYQPSSMDNSGSIYKKVDLKNPSLNTPNSWFLSKKDDTKNLHPNQNYGYTSYDGKARTSIFDRPLSSYQNNIQGILNSPSNDIFAQNMISVISNSVQAPLDGTKAIFDITRANFPHSPVSHIIRLTNSIVQSVMLNLRQSLNTIINTLYGRRAKRDFNGFEIFNNLPGTLVNKYYHQSTDAPTTKNINLPNYYNQQISAGQQPTADYYVRQPATAATENMLGQRQTYYGSSIDQNSYRSQYDYNIGVLPQPANTQNYVLNSLVDAITSAIRSNVPDPYSVDAPEIQEYTQQVIVAVELFFNNQIDNILRGQSPTSNKY